MSRYLPVFPLPGVVLLPETVLPLHIFEMRYRRMVADALEGDRMIGMALLEEGADPREPAPPIHPVGGAGEIVESEALEDGRYNIVLRGSFRFRVVDEVPPNPYRIARVEEVPTLDFPDAEEGERARRLASELFERIRGPLELPDLPEEPLSAERLASELALRLRYAPAELQKILEQDALDARFATLIARMSAWWKRIVWLAPYRPEELDVTRN